MNSKGYYDIHSILCEEAVRSLPVTLTPIDVQGNGVYIHAAKRP
jgi:hypothetical protein